MTTRVHFGEIIIDLSTLWNAWNGTLPSYKDRQRELIVGGDLNLSEDVYVKRLDQSIRTCFALLKPKHWLSVVFQHWSTVYFDAILTAAAETGGDLRAAISQIGDPVWSMRKKKGKQSVLAGEMILTFLKTDKPNTVDANKPFDVEAAIVRILDQTPKRDSLRRISLESSRCRGVAIRCARLAEY